MFTPGRHRSFRLQFRIRAFLAIVYLVLLTFVLGTPHPLWLFGRTGQTVERAVELTLSGFSQHVTAYTLLIWLLLFAFGTSHSKAKVLCLLLAVAHGLVMEGVQYFIPLRCCDWADTAGNLSGVGIGLLVAVLTIDLHSNRSQDQSPQDQSPVECFDSLT